MHRREDKLATSCLHDSFETEPGIKRLGVDIRQIGLEFRPKRLHANSASHLVVPLLGECFDFGLEREDCLAIVTVGNCSERVDDTLERCIAKFGCLQRSFGGFELIASRRKQICDYVERTSLMRRRKGRRYWLLGGGRRRTGHARGETEKKEDERAI